jgi:hypothetical protein
VVIPDWYLQIQSSFFDLRILVEKSEAHLSWRFGSSPDAFPPESWIFSAFSVTTSNPTYGKCTGPFYPNLKSKPSTVISNDANPRNPVQQVLTNKQSSDLRTILKKWSHFTLSDHAYIGAPFAAFGPM